MDNRQTKITVGEGLQESRLNTELIAWIQKYGSYALYGLLVVVIVYAGTNWWSRRVEARLDDAFVQLDTALTTEDPQGLLRVAEENSEQGAVAMLARRDAAFLYLDAVRRRVKYDADPLAPADEDMLTDAAREEYLTIAETQLRSVLDDASTNPAQLVFAQQARWGLATIAIERRDWEQAERDMQTYMDAAASASITSQVASAEGRLGMVRSMKDSFVELKSVLDLPESSRPSGPTATGSGTIESLLGPGGLGSATQGPQLPAVPQFTLPSPDEIKTLTPGETVEGQTGSTPTVVVPPTTPTQPPGDAPDDGESDSE